MQRAKLVNSPPALLFTTTVEFISTKTCEGGLHGKGEES